MIFRRKINTLAYAGVSGRDQKDDLERQKIVLEAYCASQGINDSFYREGNIQIKGNQIKLPRIGWVKTYEKFIPSEVVIEDLNVSGMLKNHRLAQAIADGGFYEFRRQLEYKCEWYGSQLTVVDRFFPSSKTCSDCGEVNKDLKLSDRTFICPSCGFFLDRDLNGAINLSRAGSSPVSACGVLNKRNTSVKRTHQALVKRKRKSV